MSLTAVSSRFVRAVSIFVCVLCSVHFLPYYPDEGMWTFDNPPLKLLKEKYGFTPTQQWLDHVRLASVRFNDGGSGSFISPTGLVLTNHHVARGQLQKMSSAAKDYVADGFYAKTQEEEIKCPDLELNVLMSTENVTARVEKAVAAAKSTTAALEARKAIIATIQSESMAATGLRSDVVTLYAGGEYWLYRYKKYTDVRLVFAPEAQIAFYGGDPDNFTYPRYDLDMAIFRVYENDKPLQSENYFRWNSKGAADGELVFVSGNPGSTDRMNTMAQLQYQRDKFYPLIISMLKHRIDMLKTYAARGAEQSRQVQSLIFGSENSYKAFVGEYEGLMDKNVMAKKQKEENEFRDLVAKNPEWQKEYGSAWDEIAAAVKNSDALLKPSRYRSVASSRLAGIAMTIVQYVAEVKKPDTERLNGFHDSQLESLRFSLFSPAPIYPELEEARLADALKESKDSLGSDDPFIQAVLNGRNPDEVAKELVAGTRLADPAARKALIEGGEEAVASSSDAMIVVARKIDPLSRRLRKMLEEQVQSVESAAGEKIGKARFAVYGKSLYPDATFTLRLSYGTVKGYPMNGTEAPPFTTFYGLYDRAYGFGMKPPFDLPKRFMEGINKIDLSKPLDFVSTLDVVGGNSGSPIINGKAELVGLVFDGNIESLAGTYVFDEEKNRTVAVHTAAMMEALRKLYDAGSLADEIEGAEQAK